ncbi:hypothetical protein BG005_001067 [Podila minutissima]|nr:hypothetical protein BG005_001067 [Podila minutissima]
MKEIGMKAEVDGKPSDWILDDLQEYRQQLPIWDHKSTRTSVLHLYSGYPAPGLFLVLPADLESWDDLDPMTHNFRFYFLCDVTKAETDDTDDTDDLDEMDGFDDSNAPSYPYQSILPQHKHFSNHPGYDLIRPQDFFQTYGSYILMIHKMVRQGFSDEVHEIPPLDTFEILLGVDLDGSSSHLTRDTIGMLVSKAINYLEGLQLPPQDQNLNGAGACAVAVLGLICTAAAAVGCVAVPAAPAVCSSTAAMLGLKITIGVIWAFAIKACDNVGSDFNGHMFAMNCDAASYLVSHPPPNGVPADVRSFYKKQCSDECNDLRKCKEMSTTNGTIA